MWFFGRGPVVPVLRFSGPIGMATPLRPGLSIGQAASAIEKAFELSKIPAVAVVVNSPGGSPVQSSLIFRRIRQLAEEKEKTVYVFCEDVAASGGYYLALAGDEIYADPSSIVGSIGVISAGFGLDKVIDRLGIERRVHTAGRNKAVLDPFRPEQPEDVERLKALQLDVHEEFIALVKERRGAKLSQDPDLFTGLFWSGRRGLALGLVDALGDMRAVLKARYGPKTRLKLISPPRGLFGRGLGFFGSQTRPAAAEFASEAAAGLIAAAEERALWGRFGL